MGRRGPFAHEVLAYADEHELAAAAVPFLRDGLTAGEMVCVVTDQNELLRQALGADAGRVTFLDAGDWFSCPRDTFLAFKRFVDEYLPQRGGSARVLAGAVWTDRGRAEVVEWQRLEAAVNVVFADAPLRIACCYDRRRVSAEAEGAAAKTHPGVRHPDGSQPSSAYVPPEAFIDQLERGLTLPAPPATAMARQVNADLRQLRHLVRTAAADAAVSPERTDDAVLVANELATNVLRHSSGQGQLFTWAGEGQLVCELRDPTGSRPPPLGGYVRRTTKRDGGWGLALVWQLADLVNVTRDEGGSAVRVTFTPSEPSGDPS